MATRGKTWKVRSEPVDTCELFAKNECQYARIRLWVGEEGINRLTYATETARRAKEAREGLAAAQSQAVEDARTRYQEEVAKRSQVAVNA